MSVTDGEWKRRERERVGKLIRGNGRLLIDEEKRNNRI
jgi:hypothetical protein